MKTPKPIQSGKCGGQVWQKARHGLISYPAFIPLNPRTPDQVAVRNIMRTLNARWSEITEHQRSRWRAVARRYYSRPRADQSGPLTGQLLFLKINIARLYYDMGQVDDPPKHPRFPPLAVTALHVTNIANAISITLTCPRAPRHRTILRACRPQRKGCQSCTDFRVLGLCPAPVNGVVDITALYIAKFKAPPVGSNLVIRVNQIIEGWEDAPREFTAIVPPPA